MFLGLSIISSSVASKPLFLLIFNIPRSSSSNNALAPFVGSFGMPIIAPFFISSIFELFPAYIPNGSKWILPAETR